MLTHTLLAVGLLALAFLTYRGVRIWLDAGARGFDTPHRWSWSLMGAIAPTAYWWGGRLDALTSPEQDEMLRRETRALGLSCADGMLCPLCGAEVPQSWVLTGDGRAAVAAGPVECPACDFRLDACR